jgi:hypothetical protein
VTPQKRKAQRKVVLLLRSSAAEAGLSRTLCCAFLCLPENFGNMQNTSDLEALRTEVWAELCLFVPAKIWVIPRKLLKTFGVPDGI